MLNDSNVFITYSNDMDEVMKTLENTIQIRHEIIIIFDVMITDLFSNKKKLTKIVTALLKEIKVKNETFLLFLLHNLILLYQKLLN